jgi:hypothetical protein
MMPSSGPSPMMTSMTPTTTTTTTTATVTTTPMGMTGPSSIGMPGATTQMNFEMAGKPKPTKKGKSKKAELAAGGMATSNSANNGDTGSTGLWNEEEHKRFMEALKMFGEKGSNSTRNFFFNFFSFLFSFVFCFWSFVFVF